MRLLLLAASWAMFISFVHAAVVQIDVSGTFDADVIVNDGNGLDTSQLPVDWPTVVPGAPYSWSYHSMSVATSLMPASPNGVPDDGFFPASAFHPDVQLQFCNFDDGFNTRRLETVGASTSFTVPQDSYSELHLLATTGSGQAFMTVTLHYTDMTTDVFTSLLVPDWYDDPADTANLYHLIDGLDRIRPDGTSGYADSNDPAIFGLMVSPNPGKTLDSVDLNRVAGGGFDAIICFFGATGVASGAASSSLVSSDLVATALAVTPVGTISPGSTFDVDVTVDSNFTSPRTVTVDLFYGPGEPTPGVPAVGAMSTQIMVPAGGQAVASFVGIPAAASPEVWRVHGLVNSDLLVPECNLGNNVISDSVCIADTGCAASCGDCDQTGSLPPTILDSLISAQISAGLVIPTMPQLCDCDVNSSGAIEILDALLIAQTAAGLPVTIACGSGGAAGVALALLPASGQTTVDLELDVCGPAAVDLVFEFSTDAGATYAPATAAPTSPVASPAPGTATGTLVFGWDASVDVPTASRPVTAELRVTATDPVTLSAASAVSTPIMLVAGVCTGTVEADLTGLPLPLLVPGNTAGADDTSTMSCVGGGGDHVYLFVPAASAQHTFSLCGSSYDTALEVRQMDCATGLSLGCNDDSCGLQSQLSAMLTAGTPYYVIVDGFGGSTGAYTLGITSP